MRDDWQLGDGAVTSVNFSAIKKSREADSRQWVVRSVRGTMAPEDPQAMIARVQSSKGPTRHVTDTGSGVCAFSIR
jgi:hypothetical protein